MRQYESLSVFAENRLPQRSYYIPYENDTGVHYTLEYTQYFYQNWLLVKMDTYTLELSPGETVKIPVVFPEDSESWDTWTSGYSYKDLKL